MDPGHGPDESESEYTSSSSESECEDVEDTSLDLFISKSDVEAKLSKSAKKRERKYPLTIVNPY